MKQESQNEYWRLFRGMMIKDIVDLPDHGLFIPLSVALGQTGNKEKPPSSKSIYRMVAAVLDSTQTVESEIRGSIPQTGLQQLANHIERRGNITHTFTQLLDGDIQNLHNYKARFLGNIDQLPDEERDELQSVSNTMWNVMSQLPYSPDIDLVVKNTDETNFQDASLKIRACLQSHFKPLGQIANPDETEFTEYYALPPQYWVSDSLNPQAVILQVRRGEIDNRGVQYLNIDICITPMASVVKNMRTHSPVVPNIFKNSRRVASIFYSMEAVKPAGQNGYIENHRLDPDYGLSWDTHASGALSPLHNMTENSCAIVSQTYGRFASQKKRIKEYLSPAKARNVVLDGVGMPRAYAKPEDEHYFGIQKDSLQILCQPIRVGEKFKHIRKSTDKFLLALRAAQKGSMYEDLLQLTVEGRLALASTQRAKAIDPSAIQVFQDISLEDFKTELQAMDPKTRQTYIEKATKIMMTGLFYPQKFLEYAKEVGIFRFFPNLHHLLIDEVYDKVLRQLNTELQPWDKYLENLHAATFFDEDHDPLLFLDAGAQQLESLQRRADFVNPYQAVFYALTKEGVVPKYIHFHTTSYLQQLGQMLSLNWEKFESLLAYSIAGGQQPRGIIIEYQKIRAPVKSIFVNPNHYPQYEKEYLANKRNALVAKIASVFCTSYLCLGPIMEQSNGTDVVALLGLLGGLASGIFYSRQASLSLLKMSIALNKKGDGNTYF